MPGQKNNRKGDVSVTQLTLKIETALAGQTNIYHEARVKLDTVGPPPAQWNQTEILQ
jgi:hypothetical protein